MTLRHHRHYAFLVSIIVAFLALVTATWYRGRGDVQCPRFGWWMYMTDYSGREGSIVVFDDWLNSIAILQTGDEKAEQDAETTVDGALVLTQDSPYRRYVIPAKQHRLWIVLPDDTVHSFTLDEPARNLANRLRRNIRSSRWQRSALTALIEEYQGPDRSQLSAVLQRVGTTLPASTQSSDASPGTVR